MQLFKSSKTKILLAVFAITAGLGVVFLQRSFASSGQIYISPASSNVAVGSNVTVSLRINPGVDIDTVQDTITFDTAKLQYVSTDGSTSAFPNAPGSSNTVSGGTITVGRFSVNPVNGDSEIVNFTFKALVSSGSATLHHVTTGPYGANATAFGTGTFINPSTADATVNFTAAPDTTPPSVSITAPASGATLSGAVTLTASASDNVGVTKVEFYVDGTLKATNTASPYSVSLDTTGLTNASHTLTAKAYDAAGNVGTSGAVSVTVSNGSKSNPSPTAPTPTPTPTSGGTTPTPTSGGTTPTPTPGTPSPAAATTITAVLKDVEFTEASITVTGSAPVQAWIEYGLASNQLILNTPLTAIDTTNTVTLNPGLIIPGTVYYYKALAKDAKGNQVETPVQTFMTKGYTVLVRVLGQNNQLLKHKKVTLSSTPITVETDGNGLATYTNVPPGTHHVIFVSNSQTYTKAILVANTVKTVGNVQTATPQNIAVVYSNLLVTNSPSAALIWVTVIIIAVLGAFLIIRRSASNGGFGSVVLEKLSIMKGSHNSPTNYVGMQQTPPTEDSEHLINSVSGVNRPNPGTVVKPSESDQDKDGPHTP